MADNSDGPDFDSLTIRVNGNSFSLSLGLREAILKDIETNIRAYGDPGVFTGGAGFASASYLGSMTRDVLDKIGRLERMATDPRAGKRSFAPGDDFMAQGPTIVIPAPPALPVFAAGLLLVGWLRTRRRCAKRAAL
jgi:hypothetical protein